MTNKVEKLISKCSSIRPLEGRILVMPSKVRTYKSIGHEAKPSDPNVKVTDIIPGETEMTLEEKEIDVNYRYQVATVLVLPEDEQRFKVGDQVLYNIGSLQEFDYIKDVSILRKYDVVGVVKTIV